MNIRSFIESLQKKYPEAVKLNDPAEPIPGGIDPLHELYALSDGLELPFGRIFSVDAALTRVNYKLFGVDWFCFGYNYAHTFWLCLWEAEDDDLWITAWDSDSKKPVGNAVWKTVEEFLSDTLKKYEAEKGKLRVTDV